MHKARIVRVISEAMAGLNPIRITYKKLSGNKDTVIRIIEPYDMKEEELSDGTLASYVYGYDISPTVIPQEQHTKRWKADQFVAMHILKDQVFTPRY